MITGGLASGKLTAADFGRAEGQAGGRAELTAAGKRSAAEALGIGLPDGGELDGDLVRRLNMAAAAHFGYVENVHYVLHDGRAFIIDQTTHEVLFNPETATESRWNGGLAQAIEARHGLVIRDDSAGSRQIAARELYARPAYGRVTGASGTAAGKGALFQKAGLSGRVTGIPRYYASRLETAADHVSPGLAAKLDTIAADTAALHAAGGQPQLILAHRNDLVAGLSGRLDGLGVAHTAIDARWFLDQGTRREEAFAAAVDRAGRPGQVLVINMQGARGVDIPLTAAARDAGGLHVRVTARSGLSADIDIQAQNRAARSGDPGSVAYYISPDDDAFALSHNPHVQHAVIRYTQAQTTDAVTQAETRLRNLVPVTQAEAARRMGMHTPTHQPNAPPVHTAATAATATAPTPDAQPPDRPPAGQLAIATPTGHYLPATGPDEVADPQALQAALFMHPVQNATVLHLHADPAAGQFLVGGQQFGPDELHAGVLAQLGLVPGQPLILVACGSGAVPTGAAARLAVLAGAPVLAPTTTAVTTPSGTVLAAETGVDSTGLPIIRQGQWAVFGPDAAQLAVLPADLTSALRHGGVEQYLPGVRLAPGAAGRPPKRNVTWNLDPVDSGPGLPPAGRAPMTRPYRRP